MRTKAVRLYGKNDLRLEDFNLPDVGPDGILVEIVSDSLCLSSYKESIQGADHKRVPNDISTNPIIIGHEFCGRIVEVGDNWKHKYREGDGFAIQPAHFYEGSLDAPGYSYHHCGGNSTYSIIPIETLKSDCLLTYDSDVYFYGSLAEPMSCVIGGYHSMYHTTPGSYEHSMGIVEGGKLALLASVGAMGMGAIDYALNSDRRPSLVVVTDIDDAKLARAASIYTVEDAAAKGITLQYINTSTKEDPISELMKISDGTGYDDVFCFAPVRQVVEQAASILGFDGCLNFFAGPTNTTFMAELNFYDVHYSAHHLVANSGGNTDDMKEAIALMNSGRINPAAMITHVGGLDCVAETTINLPKIAGGKKLIYNHISMPLTAIDDFAILGESNPIFKELDRIVQSNNGLWNGEAEKYLLANAKSII